MITDQASELSPELMDDFYSECDSHLRSVREALVRLEQNPGLNKVETLEKLFRSFHSLKGIIAMVGITSAERVAHRIEDYLRLASRDEVPMGLPEIDLVVRATDLIERTVASFRDHRALPDATPLLADMETIAPTTNTPEPDANGREKRHETVEEKIATAISRGLQVWKCTFVPSAALNEQGVNVNAIRELLAANGEIIHAAPKVTGNGMSFTFWVATGTAPANRAELEQKGVSLDLIGIPEVATSSQAKHSQVVVNPFVTPSQTIRVGLERLDELMRVTGELVIQRARLEEQVNGMASLPGADIRGLQEVNVGFGRQFRQLREIVMRLRMVPISELFDRVPFVVRDLTRNTDKKVKLDIHGQQTELDKFVVEQLKAPLLHLVRNAVSHGIENGDERVAAGKPREATLRMAAKTVGEAVVIEIYDDGRGIDREKVVARAAELGVTVADDVSNASLLELICLPGFSTRDQADRAAGRGVGMAVVNTTLRELGGRISLETQTGGGTLFRLRLPLTLLITEALIVRAGDQQFAIPQSTVDEVLQIDEADVKRMERAEIVSVRGNALRLVRLHDVFSFPLSNRVRSTMVVCQTDSGRVGLVVDRITGHRQVVVRSLRDPLVHIPGIVGATELGDGRPLLILDPLILTRHADRFTRRTRGDEEMSYAGTAAR